MTWFVEKYGNWSQGVRIERMLAEERSPFQKIELLETRDFGRLLVLDGKTQVCELDEFVYHEMMAHVPLLSHPNPQRVLVMGGGDGGTVREVLRHPVREVRLVEIDERVMALSRQYLPGVYPPRDERIALVTRDASLEIREARDLDIILVDSSDPEGPSERLFTAEFFREVAAALRPGGVVALQAGSPFLARDQVNAVRRELAQVFSCVRPYLIPVPTYPGGTWTLIAASQEVDVMEQPALEQRYLDRGLVTRYYHPDTHRASLALPPFLRDTE